MSLIVHPKVQRQIEIYSDQLPQALLLTGRTGVGLSTIAHHIASRFQLDALIKPELLTKTSTIPQISVDRIRELYSLSRGKRGVASVVIIDDVDTMTESAQNSFLKLLEEPPANTHFILTTHSPERLLPTVHSRLQSAHIPAVSVEQSRTITDSLAISDDIKRRQILFLATGLPAELHRLSNDDAYFTLRASRIKNAKEFAEGNVVQRLSAALNSNLNREEALATIKQLVDLLSIDPRESSVVRIKRLLEASERIEKGGNIRLQLTYGVL